MQSVVLDGVRRNPASGARPQALVLGTPRRRPAPLSQNMAQNRIGMDGVRRSVPTPQEVLQAASTAFTPVPEVLPPKAASRPIVAFSIIASALIVAGVTGSRLVPARAADEASLHIKAPAIVTSATPVATPSATPATPAATPTPKAVPAVAQAGNFASVQAILDAFVAAHGSQYTIYVKDLKTGTTASINADRVMTSASLYKLFVAQRIYQKVDAGELSYGQIAGAESNRTIDGCLTVMINISDNACGHDLGQTIGWSKQDSMLKNSGYTSTSLGGGDNPQLTNAKDVGLLLEHLYNGTLMSPNATNRFMTLLKQQKVNDRFPTGLPAETVIAHKTGDLFGYTHDAGIVYGSKTDFEVVVMSGPWTSPENSKPAFGILAGQLNRFFNN
ncbi:MAG: serine hydrolase [Candidatus Saccharibacteria bacterium]